MTPADRVRDYARRGWAPIFWTPAGSGRERKRPRDRDWPTRVYDPDDYQPGQQVGIRLGAEIDGQYLVDLDVDTDDRELQRVIVQLLPETHFIFGRRGKPVSHCFYYINKPLPSFSFVHRYFNAETSGETQESFLEFRSCKKDGSIGLQTIVPPSTWESRDETIQAPLEFCEDGEPTFYRNAEKFFTGVQVAAIGALFAKYFGENGFGHHPRLAWCGYLLSLGLDADDVVTMGHAISAYCKNLEVDDVARTVTSTQARIAANLAVTGRSALIDLLGARGLPLVTTIEKWLGKWSPATEAIDRLNQQYFTIDVGSETVVGEIVDDELRFRSFEDFRKKLIKETVSVKDGDKSRAKPLADVWLRSKHGRAYDRLVYAPTGSRVYVGEKDFNGWKGLTVSPAPGTWDLTRNELIRNIACGGNDDLFEWTLDWMADLFQQPGIHAETALVFTGSQGVGKNVLAGHVIGQTFDKRHARVTTHTRQVLGEFNDILSGLCLLVLDEVGLTSNADYSAVKGLITGHSIDINRKGIRIDTERSMLHVIFLSNNEIPIRVAADDRRFVFYRFSSNYANNTAFFDEIAREMASGGRAAMLHELLARPVRRNRLRLAPDSAIKQFVKRDSWNEATWFFYSVLRDVGPEQWATHDEMRRVKKDEMLSEFHRYLHMRNSKKDIPDARSLLLHQLRKLVPADFEPNRPIRENGVLTRAFWTLPPYDVFVESFSQATGVDVVKLLRDDMTSPGDRTLLRDGPM